jgi:hypothetical protein
MKNPFSPPCRALFICSNAIEWRRRPYWVNPLRPRAVQSGLAVFRGGLEIEIV